MADDPAVDEGELRSADGPGGLAARLRRDGLDEKHRCQELEVAHQGRPRDSRNASGRLRRARIREDPVRRKRPGRGSRSTRTLIALSSSGASWISSMTIRPLCSTNPAGSSWAARRAAASSSRRTTVPGRLSAGKYALGARQPWSLGRCPRVTWTVSSWSLGRLSCGHLDGSYVVTWTVRWRSSSRRGLTAPGGKPQTGGPKPQALGETKRCRTPEVKEAGKRSGMPLARNLTPVDGNDQTRRILPK
jgi:hypothetical protein